MTAALRPLTADRGSKFSVSVRHLAGGAVVPHTGDDVALVLLRRQAEDEVLASFAGVVTDGWISVTLTDEDTAGLEFTKAAYRLVVADEFLLVGPFTVRTPADV